MLIISTRKTDRGRWTYFKAADDTPRYYRAEGTRFALADVTEIANSANAVQALVDQAKALRPDDPNIVLFVHGYNNTVESACRVTSEILRRLGALDFAAAGAALCWPTDGRLLNYRNDRDDAKATALAVSRALGEFAANEEIARGAVRLSLISHSMGNFMMNLACKELLREAPAPPVIFSNTILTAADINRNDLEAGREGHTRCRMSSRVTFYYSGWDATLIAAQGILKRKRLGREGPDSWENLPPNVIGVNCSDVIRPHTNNPIDAIADMSVELHSGYYTDEAFYRDLVQVLGNVSPDAITTRRNADGPTNSYRLVRTG